MAILNNTNQVVTTEDIRNEQGTLLVPRGTRITPEISRKIAHHKLHQPVESSVSLESILTPDSVVQRFEKIPKPPEFVEFQRVSGLDKKFHDHCKTMVKYPLIMQKLTVMSERVPVFFDKSLLSAYMALTMCEELKLSEKSTHHVFIASMTRDVGILHINPEVVLKNGVWSPQEARLIQGHVIISHVFLKDVPELPPIVARAVLEHHERTDGLGYPYGKVGSKLCLEGQIVALSDMVLALINKQIRQGYSMQVIIPILQINGSIHFTDLSQAAIRILRRLTIRNFRAYNDMEIPSLIKKLIKLQESLLSWVKDTRDFAANICEQYDGKYVRICSAMLARIQATLISSGVISSEHKQWLENTLNHAVSEEYSEIECVAIMFDEISWQFRQLNNALALAIENIEATDLIKKDLLDKNTRLDQFLNGFAYLEKSAA